MNSRTVAIVQARMGSTRLPGKVLRDLGGATVLARVLRRLARTSRLDEIVVATTGAAADGATVEEANRLGFACFRGSELDVLDRYYQTAVAFRADVIVRITSDCPLIDPAIIDMTIDEFCSQSPDYASNFLERTYPRGLDTEVFSFKVLKQIHSVACHSYEREHVTPYFYEHPELFKLRSVKGTKDHSHYRWTLDTEEDLRLIRTIYSRMGNRDTFAWTDVIALMESEPELAEINCRVVQKAVR